jgi:hypothetical protein
VFDFKDGAIATTEGTWLAGKDSPAAMIMPANPKVGDVYRTENSPGFAFEEVTVKSVDWTLAGPLDPVDGGIVGEELHMDGTTEDKTFAPGYGEYYTAAGGDVEALALAVPTDAASGPVPAELKNLSDDAFSVFDAAFDAAQSKDWNAVSSTVDKMKGAWKTYGAGEVPKRVEPRMTEALAELTKAVDNRDPAGTQQAALNAAHWSLDLQLRYRPSTEIDLARFDLWAAQLVVDAAAADAAAVNSDIFTLDYIRDRILPTLHSADVAHINTVLGDLQGAQSTMSGKDLAATANAAERLRDILRQLR